MNVLFSILIVLQLIPCGTLKQKTSAQTSNDLTIGCECLDRGYTDYHNYKRYPDSLGMHFARFQAVII